METVAFKYRAFLSYSHRDAAWGKWLHAALENYSTDKDLIGWETSAGPIPKTLRPIFRDREDFAAGPSLPEQTIAALESSRFLIVICSPNSAQSKYVNEEIRRFKALGRGDYIIPVIVAGEPHDPERECFPPALAFQIGPDGTLTDEREEPIAADARPDHDGKDLAKLKVVAGLLGLGLDEIVRRAERARRKRVQNWGAALLVLTATFAGLAVWAEINRRDANIQKNHAEQETIQARRRLSSALTALARTELAHRPENAAKLALAAWPRPGAMDLPKREVTLDTVSRNLTNLRERMRITTGAAINAIAFSPDGARVLTGSEDKTAGLWEAATGKELGTFKGHEDAVSSV
ncbi:MAG: toll/interleukin-1 receptor domain-containing protein, partial [Methylocella sp.]